MKHDIEHAYERWKILSQVFQILAETSGQDLEIFQIPPNIALKQIWVVIFLSKTLGAIINDPTGMIDKKVTTDSGVTSLFVDSFMSKFWV